MKEKIRGFETVSNYSNVELPTRSDNRSAGYDFYIRETVIVNPHEMVKISTGVKAYMQSNEVLMIYPRSSLGIKKNLMLANSTGVIDSSYYNNPDNEGNIIIALYNYGDTKQIILAGDRIAQGVFVNYLTADEEVVANSERTGGIGSSGN